MTARQPAQVFPVGEYIQDELNAREWTVAQLAQKMRWSEDAVNDLIYGKIPLAVKMAFALGRAFGTGPELWMNLDRAYLDWRRYHDRND